MPGRRGLAITTLDLSDGQIVLVRARVVTVFRHAAVVNLPTLRAGDYPLEVPFTEIFQRESTDALAATLQAVQARGEALQGLIARAVAEVYELGAHATAQQFGSLQELPAPSFWPPAPAGSVKAP